MDIKDDDDWSLDAEQALTQAIKDKAFVKLDARHGREGRVALIHGQCDKCETFSYVLAIDQSEGEYAPGALCYRSMTRL